MTQREVSYKTRQQGKTKIPVTALVLAGGQSRRMGQNKALLTYGKSSFIEKILGSVQHADQVLIAANDGEAYEHLQLPVIKDVYYQCGPMAGIHAGLVEANHDWSIVLPCDTPEVNQNVVNYLMSEVDEDYDAIVTRTKEGKLHPLLGLYHRRTIPLFQEALERKELRLMSLLKKLKVKEVALEKGGFDVEQVAKNINTPEEYAHMTHKKKKPPVMAVSGVSNSGKTTVLTKLVRLMSEKGYRIGTIKHDGHGFDMDHEGKDTYRHREAGAQSVIIASRYQYAMIKQTPEEEVSLEKLIELQKDYDLILLEGFKFCQYPKVEVVRRERSQDIVCDESTLLGIVTDVAELQGRYPQITCLDLQDTKGLMALVEQFIKEHQHHEG